MSPARFAAGAVVIAVLLGGCGSDSTPAARTSEDVELTVFAAASLKESFTTLGEAFEEQHPGTTVTFVFGPSSGLARQINEGAPADVFASASTRNMDEVTTSGKIVGEPRTFARNSMQIAVPAGNPGGIDDLSDLARPQAKVALCQEQVPCGVAAAAVLDKAGVTVNPATREADVKAVTTKVELGEVDAGIVYVTDVRAAGDEVRGVPIPDDLNATTDYPIGVTAGSAHPEQAEAFLALVTGEEGKQVLTGQGFTAP